MNRRITMMAVILLLAIAAMAQEKGTAYCTLKEIEKGWKTKPITNVINGSLGIMLERFDQTWPTWMVGAVRNTMEKGLDKEVLDDETELTIIVDAINGYVEVSDAGTDGEYMTACVWNRSNGHKLLAVCMGDPTDPFIEFVCFYDYDSQQRTLTPEPDILTGFRKWTTQDPYFCRLPRRGKNLVIDDWGDGDHVLHTFTWDGMKPVYKSTKPAE